MGIFANIKQLVGLGKINAAELVHMSEKMDRILDGIELMNSSILSVAAAIEDLQVLDVTPDPDEEEPPVDPGPSLDLIEMVEDCAFYEFDYNNTKGKPVMKGIMVGYKAVVGERYLVESQVIDGDSAIQWYRIWVGMNDDTSVRGHYIKKGKAKPV